ncbi:hypothetical protein [Umezawaea sp. Da 62-37]|uniref:hypothetical protein n=1 Tax=Umezawaea sp. Da 62-37 TaxID=3075927 RepID=UPI0028F72FF0|nr:hypothetical protein [Umezawaea sp. Da 62-37]WNV83489.1 hypothetical protein RM788_35665 [Umezawaea sp. Da 62-37]
MNVWNELDVEAKVFEALEDVTIVNEAGHHFGRPFMTAYQLALKLDHAHPHVKEQLGREIGGTRSGHSLAQYFAHQLSQRIKRQGDAYPVEGAFLSNDAVAALVYLGPGDRELRSSLTGSGLDVSMYRRRRESPRIDNG